MSHEIRRLLIDEIQKRLAPVEATPSDVDAALFAAISLRGSAGLAGETQLATALTRLEARLRVGDRDAIAGLTSLLRRAVVRMADGESAAEGTWPLPPDDLEPKAIAGDVRGPYEAELKDRLAAIDQCLGANQDPVAAAQLAFRHVHTLKGASSAVGDEPMSWFCHGLEERLRGVTDEPSAEAALLELGRYRGVLGGLAEDPRATLRKLRGDKAGSGRFSSRPAPNGSRATAPSIEGGDEGTVRVAASALAHLLEHTERIGALRERLDGAARRARDIGRKTRAVGTPLADDVDALAEELRATTGELGTDLLALKRTVASLLLTTMDSVFTRLVSVIEADARRLKRAVKVRIAGADEPLDRRLAERLIEPCVQIARNAVAHGVEPADVRRAGGKDAAGTISLSARRVGPELEIRVGDDGPGVDLDSVREQAVRTGALGADQARAADDATLLALLLRPGFSTQRAPDLLAGRGIGLDITANAVEKLGGSLRLLARPGQGFVVRIGVPIEGATAPPPSPPTLEPMTDADLAAAADIVLETTSTAERRDEGTRRLAATTRFREELGRPWARVRVARVGGHVAAYLVTWQVADEVHVLDVATARSAQRRGIARALMTELVTLTKAQPVRHVLLEVRRSNAPAIRLYRSLGFFATNVRRRYYDDGEDAVEMRLVLDEATREVRWLPDEIVVES